jgi:hypothetical protein
MTSKTRDNGPVYSLDCPCCGADCFCREKDLYGDGEEEQCACGCALMVSCDAESPAEATAHWEEGMWHE